MRTRINKEDFKRLLARTNVPLYGSSVDSAFAQFQAILQQNAHLQTRPENLVNILVDTLKRKALIQQSATTNQDGPKGSVKEAPAKPRPSLNGIPRPLHPSRAGLVQKPIPRSTGQLFALQELQKAKGDRKEKESMAYRKADGTVVRVRRRNTINGMLKPPPPSMPPPLKSTLSQPSLQIQLGPVPERRRSSLKPPAPAMPVALPQPAAEGRSKAEEEGKNKAEEEVSALKDRVRFLEKDLAARQMDFNAIKNELETARSDLEGSKQTVESLREQVVAEKQQRTKASEENEALKLEQKTTARKSRQRFDAAIDFMKALLVNAKLPDLIQVIKSRIRVIVGVERAEVYIVDEDKGELVSYREKRAGSKPLPSGETYWIGRFPVDVGIVGAVTQERHVQVVKDVEKDVRFDGLVDGIGSNGVRNLVAFPLQIRQKVSHL